VQRDAFEFLESLKEESVDLIVSSPPYCMGKEYEKSLNVADFIRAHEALAPLLVRSLRSGGSLCWQIGHHVRNSVVIPLDALVYPIFAAEDKLSLRNRIVWTFGHGVHASNRFSGRHETILWFTKGTDYHFNLDAVRVPQKYPGKRHYKGPKKGEFSGNPHGKNPSDVWEIPNVKRRMADIGRQVTGFLDQRYTEGGTDITPEELEKTAGEEVSLFTSLRETRKTFKVTKIEKKKTVDETSSDRSQKNINYKPTFGLFRGS
jgi:DNA modification methylase